MTYKDSAERIRCGSDDRFALDDTPCHRQIMVSTRRFMST